jgi:hypothetical protein
MLPGDVTWGLDDGTAYTDFPNTVPAATDFVTAQLTVPEEYRVFENPIEGTFSGMFTYNTGAAVLDGTYVALAIEFQIPAFSFGWQTAAIIRLQARVDPTQSPFPLITQTLSVTDGTNFNTVNVVSVLNSNLPFLCSYAIHKTSIQAAVPGFTAALNLGGDFPFDQVGRIQAHFITNLYPAHTRIDLWDWTLTPEVWCWAELPGGGSSPLGRLCEYPVAQSSTVFTTRFPFVPGSTEVYRNGLLQRPGVDYAEDGVAGEITFSEDASPLAAIRMCYNVAGVPT